jgi:hypothetical protein
MVHPLTWTGNIPISDTSLSADTQQIKREESAVGSDLERSETGSLWLHSNTEPNFWNWSGAELQVAIKCCIQSEIECKRTL